MSNSKISKDTNNMGLFIDKLKKEDNSYGNLSRGMQIFYLVMMIIYSARTVVEYLETREVRDLVSGFCMPIAFLIFVIVFGKFHKEFKYVDYSLPTISMLKNVVKRYRPFQFKNIWVFVAMLIVNFGLSLKLADDDNFVEFQLIFWVAMIAAVLIGLLVWWIKYKVLYDNALALITELEGE
ncbi:hypothetical protein [Labilibaculum euxinus]